MSESVIDRINKRKKWEDLPVEIVERNGQQWFKKGNQFFEINPDSFVELEAVLKKGVPVVEARLPIQYSVKIGESWHTAKGLPQTKIHSGLFCLKEDAYFRLQFPREKMKVLGYSNFVPKPVWLELYELQISALNRQRDNYERLKNSLLETPDFFYFGDFTRLYESAFNPRTEKTFAHFFKTQHNKQIGIDKVKTHFSKEGREVSYEGLNTQKDLVVNYVRGVDDLVEVLNLKRAKARKYVYG